MKKFTWPILTFAKYFGLSMAEQHFLPTFISTQTYTMKNLSLFILFLLFVLPSKAQTFYRKIPGISASGSVNAVVATTNGGYAICGTSAADSGNVFIGKYDASGNKIWLREFGTSTAQYAFDFTQTTDGGFVIVGRNGYWEFEMLVMKVDSSGNPVWKKTFAYGNFDRANGVCSTTDNGVVIVGRTYEMGLQLYSPIAFKLNAAGNFVWGKSFSGLEDGGYSIIRTTDGKYAISGVHYSGGAQSICIQKFDSAAVYWSYTIGGGGYDYTSPGKRMIATSDNAIAITATVSSFGAGNADMLAAKISNTGSLLWMRAIGGTSNETGNSIAEGPNKQIYIGGNTENPITNTLSSYLARIDSAGSFIQGGTYSLGGSNSINALTRLTSGEFIGAGILNISSGSGTAWYGNFDATGNSCSNFLPYGTATNGTAYTSFTPFNGSSTISGATLQLNDSFGSSGSTVCSCNGNISPSITISSAAICSLSVATIQITGNTGSTNSLFRNDTLIGSTTNNIASVNQPGNYYILQQNGCGTDTSNTVQLTVHPLPTAINTAIGRTTFCEGGSVLLQTNNQPGHSYQWRKNSVNQPLATLSSYTATLSGNYNVRVTNTSTGCSKTSNTIAVTTKPQPVANVTATGPTTFCAGDSVVLQANTGSGLTYQWKLYGNDISGAVSYNYTAKVAGNYRVRVYGSNNCSKLSNLTIVNVPCRISGQQESLQAYPNPSNGTFELIIPEPESIVRIYSMEGRLVYENRNYRSTNPIDLSNEGSGVYLLTTENSGDVQHMKMIITE